MNDFLTPKFAVALMAVGVFVWAFGHDPSDATMKGAIIGGFNLALGFYLGSTDRANKATDNTAKAFDAITATAQATGSAPDPTAIRPGDTVTLDKPDEPEGGA